MASDPLDSHRDPSRLKVAGLLAIVDGRLDIDADDWRLAGMVVDASDRVRTGIATAARIRARMAEEAGTSKAVRRASALDHGRVVRWLGPSRSPLGQRRHRGTCDGGCRRRCVTQATSSAHRQIATIDDAIGEARSKGWIIIAGDTIEPRGPQP